MFLSDSEAMLKNVVDAMVDLMCLRSSHYQS